MNSPKLNCIIASLVALSGCLTGEGAALGEAAVAADEIRGTVQSAHGAEAGVWVIAETQDFQTRFAKIVVTERRPHAVAQGRRQSMKPLAVHFQVRPSPLAD
jgi:hypothetical protein